jgi:hypothetical protein
VQFPLYHEITWWKNPCSAKIPTPALPNPSMFRAHLPQHQYAGIKILHWNNRVPALITIFNDGNSQATAPHVCLSLHLDHKMLETANHFAWLPFVYHCRLGF